MAVFHDIAETRVWDIPWLPRRRGYLQKDEKKAAKELLQDDELYELWRQVDDKDTPEGKLVKDAEYFEMAITAYEYAHERATNRQESGRITSRVSGEQRLPRNTTLNSENSDRRASRSSGSGSPTGCREKAYKRGLR